MAGRLVHLVDASPYVFRAYFSLPASIVDPRGRPVNAVRGFADFLAKYVREERPTHLGVAFDESLTTSFRNDLYPDYKAHRALPPPELEAQLDACQELARALGAAVYAHRRFEADDLIGTLVHGLRRRAHRCVVVSSDKDLAQLVRPGVVLYDYARGVRYDARAVRQRFGVAPARMADYLGLAGDAVDGIPGVPGIGPKTSAALLARFDGLEALYRDLGRVAGLALRGARGVATRLAEHRELAFLSRELATIAQDAPVRPLLRELALARPRREHLEPLLRRLGLEGLRGRLLGEG